MKVRYIFDTFKVYIQQNMVWIVFIIFFQGHTKEFLILAKYRTVFSTDFGKLSLSEMNVDLIYDKMVREEHYSRSSKQTEILR